MLACTHLFFFLFFFPSLSFLLEALSGRLLVDPLGFLLAFEIISLFPAVAGLGTGAERQREREKEPRVPLGMFIKFFHYSHCIQLSYFYPCELECSTLFRENYPYSPA